MLDFSKIASPGNKLCERCKTMRPWDILSLCPLCCCAVCDACRAASLQLVDAFEGKVCAHCFGRFSTSGDDEGLTVGPLTILGSTAKVSLADLGLHTDDDHTTHGGDCGIKDKGAFAAPGTVVRASGHATHQPAALASGITQEAAGKPSEKSARAPLNADKEATGRLSTQPSRRHLAHEQRRNESWRTMKTFPSSRSDSFGPGSSPACGVARGNCCQETGGKGSTIAGHVAPLIASRTSAFEGRASEERSKVNDACGHAGDTRTGKSGSNDGAGVGGPWVPTLRRGLVAGGMAAAIGVAVWWVSGRSPRR